MTDISSASATGLYDPFTLSWSGLIINLLKIPNNIFPEVVDTVGNFGTTPVELFGIKLPIVCSVSFIKPRVFSLELPNNCNYLFRTLKFYILDCPKAFLRALSAMFESKRNFGKMVV